MTKTLDTACPSGPCGESCPHVVVRPVTDAGGSAGLRTEVRDATNEVLGLYRQRVGLEIGKASEHGARWWSRRLVEVYEEAGLVRLDK